MKQLAPCSYLCSVSKGKANGVADGKEEVEPRYQRHPKCHLSAYQVQNIWLLSHEIPLLSDLRLLSYSPSKEGIHSTSVLTYPCWACGSHGQDSAAPQAGLGQKVHLRNRGDTGFRNAELKVSFLQAMVPPLRGQFQFQHRLFLLARKR